MFYNTVELITLLQIDDGGSDARYCFRGTGKSVKVALILPSTEWPSDFARHRAVIATALSDCEPAIKHIGSTSLGDIAAKPIIDILVGVHAGSHLDAVVQLMFDAGYAYIDKFNASMPYRRFYGKLVALQPLPLPRVIGHDDTLEFGRHYNSVANIHVMKAGSYHWMRHCGGSGRSDRPRGEIS